MTVLTTMLLSALATVAAAADVACSEASQDYAEGELVLAVASHRSAASGRPLLVELTEPRQFAHGCPPARMTWRHYVLGLRAVVGALDRPEWMSRDVLWFCAPNVAWKWQRPGRWSSRLVVAGRRRHIYWRRPG